MDSIHTKSTIYFFSFLYYISFGPKCTWSLNTTRKYWIMFWSTEKNCALCVIFQLKRFPDTGCQAVYCMTGTCNVYTCNLNCT